MPAPVVRAHSASSLPPCIWLPLPPRSPLPPVCSARWQALRTRKPAERAAAVRARLSSEGSASRAAFPNGASKGVELPPCASLTPVAADVPCRGKTLAPLWRQPELAGGENKADQAAWSNTRRQLTTDESCEALNTCGNHTCLLALCLCQAHTLDKYGSACAARACRFFLFGTAYGRSARLMSDEWPASLGASSTGGP